MLVSTSYSLDLREYWKHSAESHNGGCGRHRPHRGLKVKYHTYCMETQELCKNSEGDPATPGLAATTCWLFQPPRSSLTLFDEPFLGIWLWRRSKSISAELCPNIESTNCPSLKMR
jgi:hypothetical protein